jgi:hypothetical protein
MLRRFRLVIAALLVVAVPLQGIAGVKACFCATGEHGSVATAHDHRTDHGAAHEDVEHDHSTGHEHSNSSAQSHCGACGVCCAAALTASAVFAMPSVLADLAQGSNTSARLSFRLDQPDRPPLLG